MMTNKWFVVTVGLAGTLAMIALQIVTALTLGCVATHQLHHPAMKLVCVT